MLPRLSSGGGVVAVGVIAGRPYGPTSPAIRPGDSTVGTNVRSPSRSTTSPTSRVLLGQTH